MIDLSGFTVVGSDLDGVEMLCHKCTRVERVTDPVDEWPTLAELVKWAAAHMAEVHRTGEAA